MLAVYRPPADEGPILLAKPERETHLINRVAAFDLLGQTRRPIQGRCRPVEHPIYTIEERNFLGSHRDSSFRLGLGFGVGYFGESFTFPFYTQNLKIFFFAFRICFELLLALQLFYLVQAYRMRVVLLRHGLRSNQPKVFVGALESIIAAREYRSRRFFDETMFLSAAAFYLKGNEAAVIQLGRSLPKLRVALDARKTFVGVNQESLLDG